MNNEAEEQQKQQNEVGTVELNYIPVEPIADRVVVWPIPVEEKTKSGIIIPDTAKEKPTRGMVVAISEEAQLGTNGCKKSKLRMGDEVYFGKYAATEVKIPGDDEEYFMMRELDIFFIAKRKGATPNYNDGRASLLSNNGTTTEEN